MDKEIVVVDYGMGNLRSVTRGLQRAGCDVEVTSELEDVERAEALVLPGVGAFAPGMENLGHLKGAIIDAAIDGKPLLGICLGAQMLLSESFEDGYFKGLGLIPGRARRFPGELKVPHMGWNSLKFASRHPWFDGLENGAFFYFVHSYLLDVEGDYKVAESEYGLKFAAAISNRDGNVVGTQFHPEKSGDTGLRVLANFVHF
jgi:glutamine amidotransferase